MILNYNNGQFTSIGSNQKQYDGEKIPGDLNAWDYFGTDPNELLILTYNVLSQRSTTLYHTHGPITAAINKSDTYAVGPGLVFRSQPDWKMLGITKEYAREWGMEFQRLVHYYFLMLNFYQKQSILFRTADIMGDSVLMFDREDTNGMPFDLIEVGGDQIDYEKTYKKSEADQATLGIKHDKFLRKKGVFFTGKKSSTSFTDENNDQNLIQFYHKKIARQLRGMPLAYRAIAIAKNNDRWWDAMLQRVVMETIMIGYKEGGNPADLTKQMNDLANNTLGVSGDSDAGLKKEADIKQLSGGNLFSFNSGEGIKFTDLKTPSNNFDKMQKAYIELIGMLTDIPPEVLQSQYSTSFTAHKGALNDFVKFYTAKRNTLIKNVCNVVVKEIAKDIFLSGKMKMPHPAFFTDPIIQFATLSGNWLGPVPGHINPKVEVEAKATEVENAFRTRADAAADYGNEFDNMIEEWQSQEEQWQKMNPEKQAEVIKSQEELLNENIDDQSDMPDDNNSDNNNINNDESNNDNSN